MTVVDHGVCLIFKWEQGHQIICGSCRSDGNQSKAESPESLYEVSILGSGNSEQSGYFNLGCVFFFFFSKNYLYDGELDLMFPSTWNNNLYNNLI